MSSNEKAMSIEDKIVAHMKSDTIGALVDHDALAELAKRAVNEALFRDRVVDDGSYGGRKTIPSPVREAAKEVADKLCQDAAEKLMCEVMADEQVQKLILEMIAGALPLVIMVSLKDHYLLGMERQSRMSTESLRQRLGQIGILVPS